MANPLLGVGLHAAGGAASASSIVPAKFIRGWDWNVYWLVFTTVSLLLLPMAGVALTIPRPLDAMRETTPHVLATVFALGFVYGFGSYAFGWAIRLIGFSLTYCISIGVSATLGTIIPPLVFGGEALERLFHTDLGIYVAVALVLGLTGMTLVGAAGRRKELIHIAERVRTDSDGGRSGMRFGLAVALAAGVLSAAYGLALQFGAPLAMAAQANGANPLLKMNIVFLFSNGGAFLSTLLIVIPMVRHSRVGGQWVSGDASVLARNYGLAVLGGAAWYLQFFFFGMAEFYMGIFSAASWAIHMILLIVFAQGWGVYFREWRGIDARTHRLLGSGLTLLVAAVLVVAAGNALQSG